MQQQIQATKDMSVKISHSQVRRSESYLVRECENFLTIMNITLPLLRSKWETVEELHCEHDGDKKQKLRSDLQKRRSW